MPDAFIVTIVDAAGHFELDLEIPSEMPIAMFKEKLLEILKIMDRRRFMDWNHFVLYFQGVALNDQDTLAKAGAFDGSRLTVERMRV